MRDIWRILFVICFRTPTLLIIIGFLFNTSLGLAQINESLEILDSVVPISEDKAEITNGEIYLVKVKSTKNYDDLKKFRNKKINEIMYVMDLKLENDERYFKVFVTDPPKKPKKKIDFAYLGFKYKPTNKGVGKEFFAFSSDFKLRPNISSFGKIIALLFFVILIIFSPRLIKIYKNYKRKMYLRKQTLIFSKNLLDKVKKAQSRTDYEKIYTDRKIIHKFLDTDQSNFTKFLNTLAAIQYKREWSDKETELIDRLFKEIKYFKVKSGI